MLGFFAKKKQARAAPKKRTTMNEWYEPTIEDVYAQLKVAQTMLARIPDADLAVVKREMGILEDMMWQFCH